MGNYLSILVLISNLFIYNALAQSEKITIEGKVKVVNGHALPFSTVAIKNTNQGTVTNENGFFSLNVMSLPVVLVVSNLGYKTTEVTLNSISDTKNNSIELEPEQHKLNEVVVSSKSVATNIEQKGFTATSIPLKQLQVQSVELNQVLNQSAGISVREQGGLGSKVSYSINGLEGSAVRFFLDGIPMDYFGSSYSVSTIPVSQISRIDIYKGVVPVELGSDALGGAINLVTNKSEKSSLNLDYTVGSYNTHKASLSGYGRTKKGLTGKLSAFYNYSDNNYKIWGDDISITDPDTYEVKRGITATRFHDAFESKAIKVDVGVSQKKWAEHLFLGILHSSMDKEIQHGATMIVPFGEATYQQSVVMPYLDYSNCQLLRNKLTVKTFTSFSNLNRARVDTSKNIYNWLGEIEPIKRVLGGEQKRTLNQLHEEAFLNRINLSYQLFPFHKIVANHVFSDVTRTDSDPLVTQKTEGYYSPQLFSKSIAGIAYEASWFQEKLTTSVFLKAYSYNASIKVSETVAGETSYETVESDEMSNGFGIASSYQPNNNVTISFSTEKASRLPEANEILGDGLNVISNSDLKAETSLNTNLGVDVSIFQKQSNRIRLSGNMFYRDVQHKMKMVAASDPGLLQVINFDKVQMSGVDGRLQYYHKSLLSVYQSVSYLNPIIKTDKDELGRDNGLANTRLPNTPFFQSNSELRLNFSQYFNNSARAFFYWRYAYVAPFYKHSEKYGSQNKDYIPTQNIHSIGLGYTFPKPKLTISGNINNVFNAHAFDNYAVQKPGRAFFLKLSFQII